jgi:hypothetical protein
VGDSVVSQDCKKIKKACLGILYFQIGPFEFPMRLTGAVYANLLNMELPHLLENIPLIFLVNQWSQHDGALPHFSRNVQGIFNRMYPNRWIGRGGSRHRPARSPDLNPLDFFLWGYVKIVVYNRPIHNEEDFRNRLQGVFGTITPEMVRASKLNLLRRAQLCLEMNGGHFEHLL